MNTTNKTIIKTIRLTHDQWAIVQKFIERNDLHGFPGFAHMAISRLLKSSGRTTQLSSEEKESLSDRHDNIAKG